MACFLLNKGMTMPADSLPKLSPFAGLDLLSTAVILIDERLQIRYANPAAENLFAVSQRLLVGSQLGQLLGTPAELMAALEKALHNRWSYTGYNIAVGRRTTLDELFELLRSRLAPRHPKLAGAKPVYGPPRPGDVMHSLADIGKAQRLLGYEPTHSIEQGLDEALDWYERSLK